MSKISEFFAPSLDAEKAPEPQSLDIEAIEREARNLTPGVPQSQANLFWLDERLHIERGVPRFSPWMRFSLTEFYIDNLATPSRTWMAACCGRGAGKSTLATKFATTEGQLTARMVPAGERHLFGFISTPHDAIRRVRGVDEYVSILGGVGKLVLAPQPKLELSDARGNALAYVALSARVASVSGPTFVGVVVDEEAKQLTTERSQINSIDEIIASVVPAMRTRRVRNLRISSPLETSGSFYDLIKAGTSVATFVARLGADFVSAARAGYLEVAQWELDQMHNAKAAEQVRSLAGQVNADTKSIPSWVSNPSISAIEARKDAEAIPISKLAGRTRTEYFLREYGAIPLPPTNGAGVSPWTVEDSRALAERNRELNRGGDGRKRWPGLSSCDPRSESYAGPGNGGTFPGGGDGGGHSV